MKRDLQLDGLKFVMIIFVVLFHMSYLCENYQTMLTHYINSFCMPVFIFISGYFSTIYSDKDYFAKWIIKMLTLYAITQTIQNILMLLLGYGSSMLYWFFINPRFALWYFLSLVYWRIGLILTKNISPSVLLFLSCLLALIGNALPYSNQLSVHRTLTFCPFFMLGYLFKQRDGIARLEQLPYWPFIITTLSGLVASRYFPVYMPYTTMRWIDFIATTTIGVVLCISIIRLSRIKFIERFAPWGKYTLWVYVGHPFLIIIQNTFLSNSKINMNVYLALLLTAIQVTSLTFIAIQYERIKSKNAVSQNRNMLRKQD